MNEGRKERRKEGKKEGRKEGRKERRKEGKKEGMKWISAQTSSTVKGFLMFIFYFNGVFWKKYKYFKVK